ncbi:MAG: class I SAM-dependent methyltransferase, partial [Planctomycetota bacterium]
MEADTGGYYDFVAELGVPYFHWGGLPATERLAELCRIGRGQKLLAVGCGTGYSACHLAQRYGCHVVGVDLAPRMVARATERSRALGLEDRARFCVADAHRLPFADEAFDVVLTEFVTVLLDQEKAFAEYARLLGPGGFLGVNELYCAPTVPPEARVLLDEACEAFARSVGLPLKLPTPAAWETWFAGAGLGDVTSI